MKILTSSSIRWFVLGLLGIGGLALGSFTQLRGQSSIEQLATEPILLQVPVFQQAEGTSCGEAVIAMTYNYAHPNTPVSEAEVIQYATQNDYYTPGVYPYTSPANMLKITKYYSKDFASGKVYSAEQGLTLLVKKLRAGEPVIIDVLSDFSDPESEAHFIVVTGISLDTSRNNAVVIHYNDPFTGTQRMDDWAGAQGVWNAWHTNDDPGGAGWWLVLSPEG
jgi:hypothetical protein